jgi:hypothetical protein
VEEEKD